jgi:hypothetical protein
MLKKPNKGWVVILAVLLVFSIGAADPWAEPLEKVYFGDLHVHTSYSVDAFIGGAAPGRYADEAGQYAMYCSKVDFYAVTDHAEMLTDTNYWEESVRSARHYSRLGEDNPDGNGDPSMVVFPGWEWTLSYVYGHKNVILKHDDPARLPPSPIRARPGVQGFPPRVQKIEITQSERGGLITPARTRAVLGGFIYGYRLGDDDTTMVAPESGDLFRLLRKHCVDTGTGCEVQVIPHGNAWGVAPPMITDWDAQLDPINHDPELQRIIETYSKHGNSEEYSYFPPNWRYYKNGREVPKKECFIEVEPGYINRVAQRGIGVDTPVDMLPECSRKCSEPNDSYVPCCWRAGEIVAERCADPDSEWCKKQIELARQNVMPFPKHVPPHQRRNLKPEHRLRPEKFDPLEWKDCGQCRDCWKPALNYRNNGSVQKALASAYFDENGEPLHYRFGFISSTDTHSAWPASVKEDKRQGELFAGVVSNVFKIVGRGISDYPGRERGANFFDPGGLAAILADSRTRDDLWENFVDRNVYSTSGARIEVWARAVIGGEVVKMGSETLSPGNPAFHLKVNGALKEDDTCPYNDEPLIQANFTREEFQRVCDNQCYRVTDERVPIDRIEVVKVLQPMTPEEAGMENMERSDDNPKGLIMDPYHVAEMDGTQVEWSWIDKEFRNEPKGRSVAYYFRIIQKPTPGYNCRPIALIQSGRSCDALKPANSYLSKTANPQDGSQPASLLEIEDDCYSNPDEPDSFCEERAWTSPFYVIRK